LLQKSQLELKERALQKKLSLNTKLFLLLFAFTSIPLVIISFFSFKLYSRDARDIENVLFDYVNSQVSAGFAEKIQEYKSILAQIATSTDMLDFFKRVDQVHLTSQAGAVIRNQMSLALYNYVHVNSYITSVAFIDKSTEMIIYQRTGNNTFPASRLENKTFRHALLEYSGEGWFRDVNIIQATTLPNAPDTVKNYLYFTYPAADLITRELYGVLVLEVDNTVFNIALRQNYSVNMFDKYISKNSCVVSSYGTIVFSPELDNIGKSFDNILSAGSLQLRNYPIAGSSLSIYMLFESAPLQQYIINFRNIILASYLIIVLALSITIIFLRNRIIRRSKAIVLAIEEFRQTHRVSNVMVDKNDEVLFAIADQFNMMSRDIKKYIAELKEKNKRILQIKDQQRHAELQALQAQINPHFIYNALDSINWVAIDNNQDKISYMLSGLGRLLRYSISNIDTVVPLKQEIEWIEQYVYIQSERFGKSIVLSKSIKQEAYNFPIYKMLLQPLIENSILHGFRQKQDKPEIKITASILENGYMKLEISDNGSGMDKQIFTKIKNICQNPEIDEQDNIGVSNVVNRLWHYYHNDKFEISVTSYPKKGTAFCLIIPYRQLSGKAL
jgi:sensor histidine kinase YesM